MEWRVWAQAEGVELSGAATLQLTDYNIVIQAALEGQSVAMGREILIRGHLEAGRLIALSPKVLISQEAGHWLVTPKGATLSPAARAFADWLIREMAEEARTPRDMEGSCGARRLV